MSEPDTAPQKDQPTVVQLPAFPENTNVRIFIDGKKEGNQAIPVDDAVPPADIKPGVEYPEDGRSNFSLRALGTMISGAVGAVVGFFGGGLYVDNKMFEFDAEVERRTREDILGRRGLGAATAESSIANNIGSMAPGMASHEIRLANTYAVAKEGKHEFAHFIYTKLGGSKGTIPLAVAAVVGAAAAAVAYVTLKPKNALKLDGIEALKSAPAEEHEAADELQTQREQQKVALLRNEKPLSAVQQAGLTKPNDREATDMPRHIRGTHHAFIHDKTGSHHTGTHVATENHLDHQDHEDHHKEHHDPSHSPTHPTAEAISPKLAEASK